MRAYRVEKDTGFEDIQLQDVPEPTPKDDEIVVRMRACSLNYRDILIPLGGYPRNDIRPITPLSDGAGEVVEVGKSVSRFKVGDRVVGNFFQDWVSGSVNDEGLWSALGGGIDGTLSEYFVLREQGALPVPDSYSFAEAATLPCAALTAWHALVPLGKLKADDKLLLQGTGGVSIFGLQLAKAMGAEVFITSSSDEKLERAKTLGADHIINYKTTPDWDQAVLEITEGAGVDHVLEVGGAGTFNKALAATSLYGTISLIGILSGMEGPAFSLGVALNLQKNSRYLCGKC